MIIYKNILERLREAGYTSYALRQEKLISEKTMTAIRSGTPISTKTIDVICKLTKCQPGDILEYVDNQMEE